MSPRERPCETSSFIKSNTGRIRANLYLNIRRRGLEPVLLATVAFSSKGKNVGLGESLLQGRASRSKTIYINLPFQLLFQKAQINNGVLIPLPLLWLRSSGASSL